MAPGNLIYFLVYFAVVAGATVVMFERVRILKYFLYFVSQGPQHLQARCQCALDYNVYL